MKDERYYQRLYKKAKGIIGDKTPLKKDCGRICSNACCKGDENTGMLLFPHEKTSLDVKESGNVRLAVCDGRCERSDRPLSCMIFPFFPYLTEKGRIKVIPDIRGYEVCPLVRQCNAVKLDRAFLRRVKEVGRLLSEDEQCRAFLYETSREIDSFLNILG
ncbi:MAG: hypothetical protein IJ491_09010 [Clostridia bacterium]|nr:hypothetical protein [Clostridia bacterium]